MSLLNMGNKHIAWESVRPHLFRKHLARDNEKGVQVDLMRIDPNVTMAEHVHPDVEWVYILKGSLSDERGIFNEGEFLVNPKGSKHVVKTGPQGVELIVYWCGKVEVTY